MKSTSTSCQLTFVDRRGEHRFCSEAIVRMEATNSYTKVYFQDRPPFVIAKVLKVYEALLTPYGFVRTHRSHLINSRYIRRVEKQGVVMQDDSVADVARNKKAEVYRRLQGEGHLPAFAGRWKARLSV